MNNDKPERIYAQPMPKTQFLGEYTVGQSSDMQNPYILEHGETMQELQRQNEYLRSCLMITDVPPMLQPSRAQIAREFVEAVKDRQITLREKYPSWTQSALRVNAKNEVLQQWEDAEVTPE